VVSTDEWVAGVKTVQVVYKVVSGGYQEGETVGGPRTKKDCPTPDSDGDIHTVHKISNFPRVEVFYLYT
jgi:hypothetical protein